LIFSQGSVIVSTTKPRAFFRGLIFSQRNEERYVIDNDNYKPSRAFCFSNSRFRRLNISVPRASGVDGKF
jgi:hypothetical protein